VTDHAPFTTIHSGNFAHAKAYTVLSYSHASGDTTSAQIPAGITIIPVDVARIQGSPGLILSEEGRRQFRELPNEWRAQVRRDDRGGDGLWTLFRDCVSG
jgi:hypothetical protein